MGTPEDRDPIPESTFMTEIRRVVKQKRAARKQLAAWLKEHDVDLLANPVVAALLEFEGQALHAASNGVMAYDHPLQTTLSELMDAAMVLTAYFKED